MRKEEYKNRNMTKKNKSIRPSKNYVVSLLSLFSINRERIGLHGNDLSYVHSWGERDQRETTSSIKISYHTYINIKNLIDTLTLIMWRLSNQKRERERKICHYMKLETYLYNKK